MFIKKLYKNQTGNMLALTAAGLMAAVGFAALAIDVGCLFTARNQLQNAVDSAALAGASGLVSGTSTATSRAIYYAGCNDCLSQPVTISAANVTFPGSNRVRVQTTRNVQLFFFQIFGIRQAAMTCTATAELGSLEGTKGLRPLAMPKYNWNVGDRVVIKPGDKKASGVPSFYYCVDFPPMNRGTPEKGGSTYRDNIINGTRHYVAIGDELETEPGNKTGPTDQGFSELIDADPDAYWSGNQVSGSDFSGTTSPRIIKVGLYDPDDPPSSGRSSITCIGLAAFFVEGISSGDVTGRFMKLVTTGDYGGGYSLLYKAKLTQ